MKHVEAQVFAWTLIVPSGPCCWHGVDLAQINSHLHVLGRVLIIEIGKRRLVNVRFAPKSRHSPVH